MRKPQKSVTRTPAAAGKAKKSGTVTRAQQKESTRAAILQAALDIFAEHGFEGGSTRDIAAHAGVHHALIKYHYHSKDQLWRAAVSFLFERQAIELSFEPAPGALATREGRREHAREIMRRFVQYCARHPEHARLMVQESVRDSKRLRWAADTFISRTSIAAHDFVRLLKHEQMVPDVSETALVYIIVGAAQLFYTLAPEVRRVWKVDPSKQSAIDAHMEAMMAVFVR